MDTLNNMNFFNSENYGHQVHILSIAEATSREAKAEINYYLRLGLLESELRIARDFPGGPEAVVVNKCGLIKLAKQSPLGGVESAARVQAMMHKAGYPLTLDEELDIASSRGE